MVPISREMLKKNDGGMSKGVGSQPKKTSNGQSWNNFE